MKTYAIDEARKPPRIGSLAMISGTLLCAAGVAVPALGADLPEDYRPAPGAYYRSNYYPVYTNNGCYRCTCCGAPAPVAERYRVEERVPYPIVERQFVERPIVERGPVSERHWVQRDYVERSWPSSATSARRAYEEYPAAYQSYQTYPGPYRYTYHYPGPGAESYRSYEAEREFRPEREYGPGREFGPERDFRSEREFGPGREFRSEREFGPGREFRPEREFGPGREFRSEREFGPRRELGPRRGGRFGFSSYSPAFAAYEHESESRMPYLFVASPAHPPEYYPPAYEYEYKPAYGYEASPRPPAAVPTGYYSRGYAEEVR
jgi:hypothetical protein